MTMTYFRVETMKGYYHFLAPNLRQAKRIAFSFKRDAIKTTGSRYCLLLECEGLPTDATYAPKREWKLSNVAGRGESR